MFGAGVIAYARRQRLKRQLGWTLLAWSAYQFRRWAR